MVAMGDAKLININDENNASLHALRSLVNSSHLKNLIKINPHITIVSTLLLWGQLILAWSLALAGPLYFIILSFVIICSCVSAMQLWVHESSHFNLFKSKKVNDIWAAIFFAGPIGMSVKTYRRFHMTHHAKLATAQDMDRFAFNYEIHGYGKLFFVILSGLTCYEGFKIAIKKYIIQNDTINNDGFDISIVFFFVFNALLFCICVVLSRWYLYFILWVYPVLGVAVTLNIIRSMGEHKPLEISGIVLAEDDMRPVIRTTLPNFIEKWMLYQVNFNYHVEHHLYPKVPGSNLPRLYRILLENNYYEKNPDAIQKSAFSKILTISKYKKIKIC